MTFLELFHLALGAAIVSELGDTDWQINSRPALVTCLGLCVYAVGPDLI